MPAHRFYIAPGTFSDEQKRELAKAITDIYVKFGLPAFYVVVMFLPIDENAMFIGAKANVGKKFVRIYVDHAARTLPFHIQTVRFFNAYHAILAPFISDRGLDCELQVLEDDANLVRQNGLAMATRLLQKSCHVGHTHAGQ